jgi:EmrB/QacA subfamily drug resistance transporter
LKILLLIALCLPVAIACVDIMALSVAIQAIMQEFTASIAQSQWLISAYTIGTAAFLILVGKLADLYGRRKLLLVGVALFGLASLFAGCAGSMLFLIVARFLQGVSSSIMMTTVVSIIVHHFKGDERTHVLSRWTLSLGLGMALGPLVGALVLHVASWRFIFFINLPLCVVAYGLVAKYVPESKDSTGKIVIRWSEAVILSAVLILLVYLFAQFSLGLAWVFLGVVAVYALLLHQKSSALIDLSLFKLPNYFQGSACGFLSYFCMYAWLFVFAVYLEKVYGLSPLQTGFMFISYSLATAICSQFIGRVIKHWGRKPPIQFGFVIAIIAFVWMAQIQAETALWQLIAMSALPGVMLTFVNVSSMNLAMSAVPPGQTGIASGLVFTIRWLGGSIGVALLKAATSMQVAGWALALCALVGVIFGVLMRETM